MNNELDKYDFHDNKIHGISFVAEVETFGSSLCLDIDHILEWRCDKLINDEMLFSVSKANLVFYQVSNVVIDVKCIGGRSNIAPPYIFIDTVEMEATGKQNYYRWLIRMVDMVSFISFEASSFSCNLIGKAMSINRQYLLEKERS